LNRFKSALTRVFESIQSVETMMIPASYFYKDVYVRNWGEPTSPCHTPIDGSVRMTPGNGRAGLLGALLAAVLPREIAARRRVGHG
jgi:hypothetical protein